MIKHTTDLSVIGQIGKFVEPAKAFAVFDEEFFTEFSSGGLQVFAEFNIDAAVFVGSMENCSLAYDTVVAYLSSPEYADDQYGEADMSVVAIWPLGDEFVVIAADSCDDFAYAKLHEITGCGHIPHFNVERAITDLGIDLTALVR